MRSSGWTEDWNAANLDTTKFPLLLRHWSAGEFFTGQQQQQPKKKNKKWKSSAEVFFFFSFLCQVCDASQRLAWLHYKQVVASSDWLAVGGEDRSSDTEV